MFLLKWTIGKKIQESHFFFHKYCTEFIKGNLLLLTSYSRWWEANISLLIFIIVYTSFSIHVLYLRIDGYFRCTYQSYVCRHEHGYLLCSRVSSGLHYLPTTPRSQIMITWKVLDPLWNSSFWKIYKQPFSPSKWYKNFQLAECEHAQHW